MSNTHQPNQPAKPHFGGYSKPNYTMVPDELFDEQLPYLSGAQLKVLLYIMRRTFGFKKDSDAISLAQICGGITTKDGKVLDHGTGLAKRHAVDASKALVEMGLVTAERRSSPERGFEATVYSLNLNRAVSEALVPKGNKGGLVPKGNKPSTQREQALVPKGNIQKTVLQETVEQETDFENSNIRKVPSVKDSDLDTPTAVPPPTDEPASKGGVASVGDVLKRRGGRSSQPRPETETEEWQAIQAYIGDFARELGDTAPLKSSATRAYNLFQASGLALGDFLNKLFQARSLTQESTARITKTDRDPQYGVTRKTKMAYFFAVLEDQLGLLSPEEKARRDKLHADATAQYQERQARKNKSNGTGQDEGSRRSKRGRESDGPYAAFIEH